MKSKITKIALALSFLSLAACDSNDSKKVMDEIEMAVEMEMTQEAGSIVDVAVENGSFNTLVTALKATGLDSILDDADGSYTVFAPSDAAFALLGDDTITALLNDTEKLKEILLYHVITDSKVLADAAIELASADTSFTTMANSSKAALSIGADESLYVNTSKVTTPNVMASNGVIHVLDRVMLPPSMSEEAPTLNIAETAIAAGGFETLITALQAADLDSVLADESGTFTVFAPTDAAFAKIDSATLSGLLADVPALTTVLLQHVISGAKVDSVTAFSLNNTSVNTVADEDVSIMIENGMLKIQGAGVTTYDIQATNGIIHVIDTVITETLE